MKPIKAASVQTAPVLLRLEVLVEKAADNSSKLISFKLIEFVESGEG